ncbi:MAG: hypothetical protein BGP09_15980 [Rhizobium sp. 60-20]|nr:MAG: hypothetical protein BGP09_15980 [Rhizobium sp. 60-20]
MIRIGNWEEECCQSLKERWEEEVRCLRGIRYNASAGMNRPAFAMQQCAECIAFFMNAENIA